MHSGLEFLLVSTHSQPSLTGVKNSVLSMDLNLAFPEQFSLLTFLRSTSFHLSTCLSLSLCFSFFSCLIDDPSLHRHQMGPRVFLSLYPSTMNDLHVNLHDPPPEFPLTLPLSNICHLLSGPDIPVLTQTTRKVTVDCKCPHASIDYQCVVRVVCMVLRCAWCVVRVRGMSVCEQRVRRAECSVPSVQATTLI